jgi:tetratricopeptide (TPR) repeat protein
MIQRVTVAPVAMLVATLIMSGGCAQQPARESTLGGWETAPTRSGRDAGHSAGDPLQAAHQAAAAGDWPRAQAGFAAALREDLRNPQLQYLNALAYDQLSRRGDAAATDLARVGYRNAIAFDPGHYWAHLQLGYLDLDSGEYAAAQDAFANAVREQPDRWEAVYGLGVASWYLGDAGLALLAARKLEQIEPGNPLGLRLLALATAAHGDDAAVEMAQRLHNTDPGDRFASRRISEVLRLAQSRDYDRSPFGLTDPDDGSPVGDEQVVIDVTIILSSQVDARIRGINLLDGLKVQYGYENIYRANRSSGEDWNSNRSITSSINIPQLTYSLNLFNNSGQIYQVLARPSLTAFLGQESEFFAGRTVNVGVSGINLGSLQPIDVGVGLRVRPESIEGNKVKFTLSANRSFLSRDQAGNFTESLTTFKQRVSATAEVEFGQTLLLSALSEQVRDDIESKTPGLGDIPVMSTLFNNRTTLSRTESLLILVTPMRPTSISTRDRDPPQSVEALRQHWESWIDPKSSAYAIQERIGAQHFFTGARSGDLRWRQAVSEDLLLEALDENTQLAMR